MRARTAYPTYRDCGVDFLGSIPASWAATRIANVFEERKVFNHPDELLLSIDRYRGIIKQSDTGRKVRAPKDRAGYKLIEEGQLGYNILNAFMGSVGVSRYRGIVSPAYAVARLRTQQDPWYFHYLLRTGLYQRQFNRFSYGIMYERNRLYYDRFKVIPIPVPPKEDQEKIVAYLRAQDAHIARFSKAKRNLIDLLNEQMLRIIDHAVTRGLDASVALKPSGIEWLGDVPEHWDVLRIKNVVTESDDRTSSGTEQLLSLSRYHGLVPFDSLSTRPPSAKDFMKYKVCRPGQLVMNRMQAWSGLFAEATSVGLISPDYSIFNVARRTTANFLSQLFKTRKYVAQFAISSTGIGTGFNRLYTPQFGAIALSLPPLEEQAEICWFIADACKPLEEAIRRAEDEIKLIREYRDRQIADVVTGQVDVRGWVPGPDDVVAEEDLAALDGDEEIDTDGEEDDGDD